MRNDAVGDFHVPALRLFLQLHFRIQIPLVSHAEFHIVASLQRTLAVVDDRSLAKTPEEAVETFRAVAAGKTVKAERDIKDGKPLAVWALRHVGLYVVGLDVTVVAADGSSSEQIAVLGNEPRGMASAQEKCGLQQKQQFYESVEAFHSAKIRKKEE